VEQVVSLLEVVNTALMLDDSFVLPIGSKVRTREWGELYCIAITGASPGVCRNSSAEWQYYEGRVLDVEGLHVWKDPLWERGSPIIFVPSRVERVVSLPERCPPMEEWDRW
jgi:hypothetical protein